MNKLITTAGFAALGVASLHAASPMSGGAPAKPWNVSATLRGFYDDNYTTSPAFRQRESFGFEVSPQAGLTLQNDSTAFNLKYIYGMRYYDDRTSSKADHSHQATASLSHNFSPKYKADINDSFVIAQEPAVLDPGAVITVPLRSNGDNMRNTVNTSLTGQLSDPFSVVVGYSNTVYDYAQQGFSATSGPSRSALLDRFEHLFSLNLRYKIVNNTIGVVGYQYGITDYTSKESIGAVPGFGTLTSDIRDNTSHYGFVGVDQMFTPTLNGSVRVGVQAVEYTHANRLKGMLQDSTSPYVDANATWSYTEGSSLQLGVKHARNQTDVGLLGTSANPTLDAESTTIYGSLNHKITAKLAGSVIGQFQRSTFNGGDADGFSDNFGMLGVNLTYEINKYLSAETGYNYDRLNSELNQLTPPVSRSYTRNRVYVGIKASY